MFAYSNGYWKVYRRFQGDFLVGEGVEKGEVMWRTLFMKDFVMGEEDFHEGCAAFSSII